MHRIVALSLLALATLVIPQARPADLEGPLKDLKSKNAKIRLKAVESLATSGDDSDKAVSALCEAAGSDTDRAVVVASLGAVEKLKPKLYKNFSTLVLDASIGAKTSAISEIGKLGNEGKPAIPTLLAVMRGYGGIGKNTREDKAKRVMFFAAVEAVAALGIPNEETAKIYAGMSTSNDQGIRQAAFAPLTEWAKKTEGGEKVLFPVIKAYLATTDPVTFLASCNSLVQFGAKAKKEFGPTLDALKLSSDGTVRKGATDALESLNK